MDDGFTDVSYFLESGLWVMQSGKMGLVSMVISVRWRMIDGLKTVDVDA